MTRLEDRQTLAASDRRSPHRRRPAGARQRSGGDRSAHPATLAEERWSDPRRPATGCDPAGTVARSDRGRARTHRRSRERTPFRRDPARPDRSDAGRRRRLYRQRIQLPSGAARAWPDEPPRPRQATTPISSANHAHRHPTGSCLVLGCDVLAGSVARTMVLSVPDPRPLQPEGRRLRGA